METENKIVTRTQVMDLGDVIQYFINGFNTPPECVKILNADWYLDQSKGKVVFQLYCEEQSSEIASGSLEKLAVEQ